MDGAYIKILTYASTLEGFNYEAIFKYVSQNDLRFYPNHRITYYDSQLQQLFAYYFLDGEGNRPQKGKSGDYEGLFYLKPEAYVYLLNYESLQQAKESAESARLESLEATRLSKQAVDYAKYSIVLTGIIALLQIIIQFVLNK
ncbi:MAG TPA: hypothetical protein VKB19_18735 [Pedobacter sp.]|nr:hypothetical protein [Pedobacter sp.]